MKLKNIVKIMNDIDLYSTHLKYLNDIFNIKGKLKNIVEFGTGYYSTELLINNGLDVMSIEMQSEEWYNSVKNKFSYYKNWKCYNLIGAFEFNNIEYPENIDMSFVDGHGDSRPECINMMMEKNCPIIVAHDTEEPGYRWDKVKNDLGYDKLDFKEYVNWTTLWTKDKYLLDQLKKMYI